jgi:hypothetical protein
MLPPGVTDPASLNFSKIFGNFYRHLFRVLPRSEFGFLHDVFESFVIEDWKGLIRGQHRYFSPAVLRNSHWMTADEAERTAHTTGLVLTEAQSQPCLDIAAQSGLVAMVELQISADELTRIAEAWRPWRARPAGNSLPPRRWGRESSRYG